MGLFSFGLGFFSGYFFRNTYAGSQLGNKLFAAYKLLKGGNLTEYKLVLVVRDDLKMGQGKIAAQCSHASVLAYKNALLHDPDAARIWEAIGQAKVVLRTTGERNLLDLYETAKKSGIPTSLVCDSGRTEVAPGTKTVIAIGPGSSLAINKVTGHLKLL
ncbi:Peptidyl-tRNA hydrolase 2, mitochondrial [Araneus ventricosus]|uniref:peptidyl-tRNA hydrolase n=1 Tax=Araneus ventricosus TaxID=182803 RepID=A0A4Y2R5M0_ARAVE|nr:Peptidyl-tRNA hydrolase 2, mitochondrial [Araneus ventricosus]